MTRRILRHTRPHFIFSGVLLGTLLASPIIGRLLDLP